MKKYIILLLALITLSVSVFGQSSSSQGSRQQSTTPGTLQNEHGAPAQPQNKDVKNGKSKIDPLVMALQDSLKNSKSDYESTKNAQQTSIDNCVFCKNGTSAYVGLCIVMVIIAILVYFLMKVLTKKTSEEIRKQFQKRHKDAHEKAECDLNKLCTLINIEQKVDAKIARYIRQLKEQIEELRRQINSPQQQVICMVTNQPETDNSTSTMPNERPSGETVSPKVEKKEPNRRFFITFPSQAGDFIDDRKGTNEDCLYEFELNPHNDREARFRFKSFSDRDMTQALNNRNERIEKVCEVIGRPEGVVTKCRPVEDGEARLENGRWIVTKKHQVRYE